MIFLNRCSGSDFRSSALKPLELISLVWKKVMICNEPGRSQTWNNANKSLKKSHKIAFGLDSIASQKVGQLIGNDDELTGCVTRNQLKKGARMNRLTANLGHCLLIGSRKWQYLERLMIVSKNRTPLTPTYMGHIVWRYRIWLVSCKEIYTK